MYQASFHYFDVGSEVYSWLFLVSQSQTVPRKARESGDTRILSWFCTVRKSVGNELKQVCNWKEVHRSDIATRILKGLMVNYRSKKFLGLLAPPQFARVTGLSSPSHVRVWLHETRAFPWIVYITLDQWKLHQAQVDKCSSWSCV